MNNRTRTPMQLSLFAEETVSVKWTAKYLGVCEMTVLRLRAAGKLSGYQYSGRKGWWQILKSSVLEFEKHIREEYDLPQRAAKAEKRHA
jgi:hypothetical protein